MKLNKILTRNNLKDVETSNSGSWENDGIGSYEFWGSKGFDKGNTYFEFEGGFSFNFPVTLLDDEILESEYLEDEINERLEQEEVPDFILNDCTPINVNETPNFKMVCSVIDDVVYVESEFLDTEFTVEDTKDYDDLY